MGDVLCRTGSLPALREALPQCRWDFLAHGAGAEVLQGNPYLRDVVHSQNLTRRTIHQLRARNYDVAICYDAVSYYRALILAVTARIPARVALTHKGMSGFITHPVTSPFPQPFSDYFQDIVGQLGSRNPDGNVRPQVFPNAEDVAAADRVWQSFAFKPGKPVVACMPFTRQVVGVWDVQNYGRAMAELHKLLPCESVFIGSSEDRASMEELVVEFSLPSRILAGSLNLRALSSLLRRYALAFTADSGPRHLANSAAIRVAFVRNTSVVAIETGIYLAETEIDLVSGSDISMRGPIDLVPEEVGLRLARLLRS